MVSSTWSPLAVVPDIRWSPPVAVSQDPYLSPVMQSNREWSHQRMAEHGAGFHERHVLVAHYFCALCRIGIGPHHYEQQLYCYPVYHKKIWNNNDQFVYVEQDFLLCCGGCANMKQRALPPICCILDYTDRSEEEEGYYPGQQSVTTRQCIEIFLLLLFLFSRGLPIQAWVITPDFSLAACLLTKKKETVEPRAHRALQAPSMSFPMGLVLPPSSSSIAHTG